MSSCVIDLGPSLSMSRIYSGIFNKTGTGYFVVRVIELAIGTEPTYDAHVLGQRRPPSQIWKSKLEVTREKFHCIELANNSSPISITCRWRLNRPSLPEVTSHRNEAMLGNTDQSQKYKAECPDEKGRTGSLDALRMLSLLRIALLIQ
jgi:hypothetical protein